MDMGGSIEDTSSSPRARAGNQQRRKRLQCHDDVRKNAKAVGVPLKGDLSIKGDGGKPTLVNEVSVTRVLRGVSNIARHCAGVAPRRRA